MGKGSKNGFQVCDSKIPQISVCLPTYNSRKYIDKRIDSLLQQTYQNFLVINVDSGSTDGTVEYLKERFSGKNFTTYQFKRGLYESWNECLRLSNSEFIHFATADDYEDTLFYEKMLEILVREPHVGCVHSHYAVVNDRNRVIWQSAKSSWVSKYWGYNEKRIYRHDSRFDFLASLLLGQSIGPINSVLIRRETFSLSGMWPICYGSSGDWYWSLLSTLKVPIYCLDDELAFWRLHQTQATGHYGRFGRYKDEARIIIDAVSEAFKMPLFSINQKIFLKKMQKRASCVAHAKFSIIFHLLLYKPDLAIHAFTKLISVFWSPFPYFRHQLRKLFKR